MSLLGGTDGSGKRGVPLRTAVRSVLFVSTRFDKWSPLTTIPGDIFEASLASSAMTGQRKPLKTKGLFFLFWWSSPSVLYLRTPAK
jgi:hypothetical protein